MKKLILISSGIIFFLFIVKDAFTPVGAQTQGKDKSLSSGSKLGHSKEHHEIVKQKIKTSKDFISLDPDGKGSFSWWGYLESPGESDFYSLVCGEGNLEIHLTSIPEFSDYDLYLYDCEYNLLAYSENYGNSDEEIIYWVSINTYIIEGYCFSGGDPDDPYHLYGTYVTPPNLPDLIVQSLTASDYTPTIGEEITITLTVKNIGNATSSGFWTDLYKDLDSPPGVPSTGDYYWWTSWLDPGETAQFTQVVTNDEVETWHMYGLVDSYGDVNERNECNNVIGPVDVNWYSLPDLVVEQMEVSNSQPFVDEWIDVTITVKNQGGRIEEDFRIDLYYNLDNPPAPYTPGNDYFYIYGGLSPGESYTCPFYIYNSNPGFWRMWLFVDSWEDIPESDENNNIDSVHVFWREYPISDNYGWPIHPPYLQHEISSTFMEYRSKTGEPYGHHFHDGIDIPAPENTPVYSVSAGFVDYTLNKEGIYVDKFLYYHVKIDTLKVPRNTWVNGDSLIAKIAHTATGDHLHFNDGYNHEEVNPLREYGINPFNDPIPPTFYDDAVTLREDDPNVGGWDGGAEGQIIDKDSVYGNVDIIVHVKDEIDPGREEWGFMPSAIRSVIRIAGPSPVRF